MQDKIKKFLYDLFPINRSISGPGTRETLDYIKGNFLPRSIIKSIKSGSKIFDWTVPPEWNVRDAFISTHSKERFIDFQKSNLHLVGYSEPVNSNFSWDELKAHLFTHPVLPKAIPYRTSYYRKSWGFCVNQSQWSQLEAQKGHPFRVCIDSDHNPNGSLTMGEYLLRGESEKEIVFSTLICHPSLANNELSGPLLLVALFKMLSSRKDRKYSYRFLFLPETIGSIAYLHGFGERMKNNCLAGFMVTCVGKKSDYFYFKKPRKPETFLEGAVKAYFRQENLAYREARFNPAWGCDDRQFCSPAYNLPFATISTTMQGEVAAYGAGEEEDFAYYHSSLDNKTQMDFSHMLKVAETYIGICERLENLQVYEREDGRGEPFLSNSGFYPTLSGGLDSRERMLAMWVLNYSDGQHSLDWIASQSGFEPSELENVSSRLLESGLIKKVEL